MRPSSRPVIHRFPPPGGASLKARLMILAVSGSLLALCVLVALPAVFTDTSRWSKTDGVLVQANPTGHHVRGKLRIGYTYQAGGRTYTGHQAALWTDSVPLRVVRQAPENWRPGTRVRVYHHPTQPERAVLDPRISPAHKAGALFGTVLSLMGVVAAFVPGLRAA